MEAKEGAGNRKIRRVLYVTAIDLSLPLGPSVNEREFVSSLHRAYGDGFRLLIPKPAQPLPEAANYRTTYLPTPSKNPLAYFAFQQSIFSTARELLKQEPVDLIVTRPDLIPWGVCRLAKSVKVPIAIKHLTGYPASFYEGHSGLKRLFGSLLAPLRTHMLSYLGRRSITVDACTQGHIEGIRKNLGLTDDRVILVENATNTDRFRPEDKQEARKRVGLDKFDFVVGYSGGVPWERGGVELITLLPRLREKFPNLGVAIVGGGGRLGELKDLAAKLGVTDHVLIPGFVPYDQIPDYVNSFDVGIAFDRVDRFDRIGNSNQKVRQYIACGLPVVVSRGGSEFVVSEGLGSVVDSADLDAVEREITKWLSLSHEQKESHAAKASAYAQKWLSVHYTISQRIDAWEAHLARPVAS